MSSAAAAQSGAGRAGQMATVGPVAHDDSPAPVSEPTLKVLVYSDDRTTRAQVRAALGRRPAADLPALEYFECATEPVVIAEADRRVHDLLILDGEATPAGGMGICRQLKDEIFECPPILVVVGRPQDAWLATWSRADGVVSHPIDAVVMADVVAKLLRRRGAVVRTT
jgi:DNA-binding response OmpR family regulator